MSYESWRISYQSSEQAARAAYAEVKRLRAALERLGEQPPAEPRELVCMLCSTEYAPWFAPSELWNAAVRRSDGSDEFPFLCPTCFTTRAVAAGIDQVFVLSTDTEPHEREAELTHENERLRAALERLEELERFLDREGIRRGPIDHGMPTPTIVDRVEAYGYECAIRAIRAIRATPTPAPQQGGEDTVSLLEG